MTQQPILHLNTYRSPNLLEVYLDSSLYEPLWEDVMLFILQGAFEGKATGFLTVTPPVWDIDIHNISKQIQTIDYGGKKFEIALTPKANLQQLKIAVSSTDFKLNTLKILALTRQKSIENFVKALFREHATDMVRTDMEYIECIDGEKLWWHNSSTEKIDPLASLLSDITLQNGWQFDTRKS